MHEKPKMELRDFFAKLDPHTFTKRLMSLIPSLTGASSAEFDERVAEAASAIPSLLGLAQQHRDASDAQLRDRLMFLIIGLATLHALAEDMGYEW